MPTRTISEVQETEFVYSNGNADLTDGPQGDKVKLVNSHSGDLNMTEKQPPVEVPPHMLERRFLYRYNPAVVNSPLLERKADTITKKNMMRTHLLVKLARQTVMMSVLQTMTSASQQNLIMMPVPQLIMVISLNEPSCRCSQTVMSVILKIYPVSEIRVMCLCCLYQIL